MLRRIATLALLAVATAALVQCTSASPPEPVTSPSAPPARAGATIEPVSEADLGASWRPGCPLEPARLRRILLDYYGFDGRTHRGALVVHEDLVPDVIAVFEDLYRRRYPIEKMRTVEKYPRADDELSIRDNNTSAFNCRDIPGTGRWSWHAYGRAIDLNPLLNPYVSRRGEFQPANAASYLDRRRTDPAMLHDGDPAVRAFTDRGWRWGGYWRNSKDYQHFERE